MGILESSYIDLNNRVIGSAIVNWNSSNLTIKTVPQDQWLFSGSDLTGSMANHRIHFDFNTSGTTLIDNVTGMTGTFASGGGQSWCAGKINSGLQFSGVTWFSCSGVPTCNVSEGSPFTIAIWSNIVGGIVPNSAVNSVFAKGQTTSYRWGFDVSSGTNLIYRTGTRSGGQSFSVSYPPVNMGEWHHLLSMYTGSLTTSGNMFLAYMDGEFIGSRYIAGSTFNNLAGSVTIGRQGIMSGNLGSELIIQVDDARFYNRVLNDYEIRTLYNNGSGIGDLKISTRYLTSAYLQSDYVGGSGFVMSGAYIVPLGGKIGGGMFFPGSNSTNCAIGGGIYISGIGMTSKYMTSGDTFSLATWINPLGTQNNSMDYYMFSKSFGNSNNNSGLDWWFNNGSISIRLRPSGSSVGTPITSYKMPIDMGSWNHLAVTFNKQYLTFYKNGDIQYVTNGSCDFTGSTILQIASGNVYFGRAPSSNSTTGFSGTMTDFRYYNTCLSSNEIQAIYNYGSGTILATGMQTLSGLDISITADGGDNWTSVINSKNSYVNLTNGSELKYKIDIQDYVSGAITNLTIKY